MTQSSCESSELTIDIPNGAAPWSSLDLNNPDCQFQFAIVTDRTGGHRPGVFLDGIRKLNLLQPEFVMSVGDLIEGYTEDLTVLNREWDEFEGFISELQMPFFYLPGNHDITNKTMENVWNERFGKTYYHFVYKNVLFLCLNSEDQARGSNRGSISDPQYEYIKKVLEDHQDVRWTLVFMHQPLWTQETDPVRWPEVESLLAGRNHHVFVGHHHNYVKYERNQGKYFILATTGGGSGLRGPELGEFDHVVWVTMTDDGPILANLLLEGVWNENVMTDRKKDFIRQLMGGNIVWALPVYSDDNDFTSGEYGFKITNDQNIPLQVEIRDGFSWDMINKSSHHLLEVAPNSVEEVIIYLENRNGSDIDKIEPVPEHFTFTYTTGDMGKVEIPLSFEIKPVIKHKIKSLTRKVLIDGSLDDWDKAQIHFSNPEFSDNEIELSMAQDEEYLYLSAYVSDDTLMVDTASAVWKQDSFNWIINSEDPKTIAQSRSYQQIRIAPGMNSLPATLHNPQYLPDGIKWASKGYKNGYCSEVAIPIELIESRSTSPWEQIRINFFVDDKDHEEKEPIRFYWNPDWRNQGTWVGSGLFFNEE